MTEIRVATWNVDGGNNTKFRQERIKRTIEDLDADILCITEVIPDQLPYNDHWVFSEPGNWPGTQDGYKVAIWSRFGWTSTDTVGSPELPPGRYVAGTTTIRNDLKLNIMGVCIPWFDYRKEQSYSQWQGNAEYLRVLKDDILKSSQWHTYSIVLGDFNIRVPLQDGRPTFEIDQLRQETFEGYNVVTAGKLGEVSTIKPIDKVKTVHTYQRHMIDHIAVSSDLRPTFLWRFDRFTPDGRLLSDHTGVFMKVEVKHA